MQNADTVTITSFGHGGADRFAGGDAGDHYYLHADRHARQPNRHGQRYRYRERGGRQRTAGDRQLRAESGYHRLRAELVAAMGGAKRHHGDDRQHDRDRGAYRLALDLAGGDYHLYHHGDQRQRNRLGQHHADGDYVGADHLVYRDAFDTFCREARRFWYARPKALYR